MGQMPKHSTGITYENSKWNYIENQNEIMQQFETDNLNIQNGVI